MASDQPAPDALAELERSHSALLREQMTAAWELHVEKVKETLESGWRAQIAAVVEERLRALEQAARQASEALAEARARELSQASAGRLAESLNTHIRRLELSQDARGWSDALLDGAGQFAGRAILLSTLSRVIRFEGGRGISTVPLENYETPLPGPPALAGAIQGLDTVVALGSPSELSLELATPLQLTEEHRVVITPVVTGRTAGERRASALLLCWDLLPQANAAVFELLSAAAGLALDCRLAAQSRSAAAIPGALIGIGAAPSGPPPMGPEQVEAHARAQRFARVRVAEIRLYQADLVRQGREEGNLYAALREQIDGGRLAYREEFLAVPGIPDYFHEEVLRTLAHDDSSLLGPYYPGPLA